MSNNEIISDRPGEGLDSYYYKEMAKQYQQYWCLRSLALVATGKMEGDSDDAMNSLYQSANFNLNNAISCFNTDCNARSFLRDLAESAPINCEVHVQSEPSLANKDSNTIES